MIWWTELKLRFGGRAARMEAVRWLGVWQSPKAAAPLAAALSDRDGEIRAAAAEELRAGLKHDDSRVREAVVRASAETGGDGAVELLGEALGSYFGNVREGVVHALGGIPGRRATDLLVPLLRDPETRVREAAAQVLDARRWEPSDETEGALRALANREWSELETMGEPAISVLIIALGFYDDEIRQEAAAWLGRLKALQAEGALAAMLDRDAVFPADRAAAAQALGQIGGARAVAALVAALRNGHREVRKKAAEALDALGWQPASDAQRAEHAVAAQDWGKAVGLGAVAVAPLCRVLYDDAADIRYFAAGALGEIGDREAAEPVARLLSDGDAGVRRAAENALKALGVQPAEVPRRLSKPRTLSKLRTLDPQRPVCSSCGQALAGGESIVGAGRAGMVMGSRPRAQVADDYRHFAGSICFKCPAVLCASCLSGKVETCPGCQGETKPAYGKHLKALAAQLR
jgi:HEAT repeat protein